MRFLELHNQLNEATKEYNYVKIISDKIGKFLDHFQKNVDKYSKNKNSDGSYSFPISDIVKEVDDEKSVLYSMRKGTIQLFKWKKSPGLEPVITITSKSTGVKKDIKGGYSTKLDTIAIPYLDFKEEDLKYGYPWVDKIKSTLLHELTHKLQNVSGKEVSSTSNLSREDWLKEPQEKEAMLNQMYEEIQTYIKNLFRLLDASKKEYFKTKDEEYKWEYVDFNNELYRIFKSEESFEKEFYGNHRYKQSLGRAEELNKIDKKIMKDFLSDSFHELRKEFENVYPEKKILSKNGKIVIEESEEEKHLGYKIVNFDGKDAYSIADKRVKYSLKKNDIHVGNIYLGTSKKYATEYYSTDSDDPEDPEELLLTYEFSPKDIKKGNLEDKDYMTGGSEIIVSKAKLVSVYNITKKKSLFETEKSELNEASQEYNIAKVLAGKIIKTLRDMAHYDLTHLDRYFKKYKDHRENLYKIPMSDFMKDIKVPEGGIFDYLKKGHVFLENGYLEKGDRTPWLYSDESKVRKAGGYFDQDKHYFGIHLPFIDAKTGEPFRGFFTEFESLIIHELTHFIQNSKEKFISGTASLSSEEWFSNKKEQEAYLHELYNDLQNFVKETLKDIRYYRSSEYKKADYEKYVGRSNMLYKMFENLELFKKSIRVLERQIFLDNPKNRDRYLYISTEMRDVFNKFLEDSFKELKKEFKNVLPERELRYEEKK